MATTTTTKAPVSRRGALITAAAAFAGGAALSAKATAAIKAGSIDVSGQGLSQLLARRNAIIDFINNSPIPIDLENENGPGFQLLLEANGLDKKLFAANPSNLSDIRTSLQFLRRFVGEGYEFDADCERLLDAVIAGFSAMGGAA
jgi:hypothetical protein